MQYNEGDKVKSVMGANGNRKSYEVPHGNTGTITRIEKHFNNWEIYVRWDEEKHRDKRVYSAMCYPEDLQPV